MWTGLGVAAGAIGGALISSNAAGKAANTQAGATQAGIAQQGRQFDLTRADTAPYRDAGAGALGQLKTLIGIGPRGATSAVSGPINQDQFDPAAYLAANPDVAKAGVDPYQHYQQYGQAEGRQGYKLGDFSTNANAPLQQKFSVSDFWNDPVVQLGYQSGLDLGTKALRNAAPLTTGLDSGAGLKELTKFGTDYSGMKAGDSRARFVEDQGNQFNKLAALAGVGQTAVGTAAASGANSANNVSQMLTAQGNAQGAAQIAGANAWSGGLQSISNWWQSQNMLNRLAPKQPQQPPQPVDYGAY